MKCASRVGWQERFRRASESKGERHVGYFCGIRNELAFRDGTNGLVLLLLGVVVDGGADDYSAHVVRRGPCDAG